MDRWMIILTLSVLSNDLFAKTIQSIRVPVEKQHKFDISMVKDSIVLEKNKTRKEDVEIRLVLIYLGKSTDVSPRYRIYLNYYNADEMNNFRTAFFIDHAWELTSSKKISQGVFQIDYLDGYTKYKSIKIDGSQIYKDQKALDAKTFTDPYFHSSIEIIDINK